VWTLIGVFATGLFGMITLMSTLFVRVIRTEIGGLRGDMNSIHERFDRLGRDINALMKHTFGIDRD
jgi:cytochrome c biogenesis factor